MPWNLGVSAWNVLIDHETSRFFIKFGVSNGVHLEKNWIQLDRWVFQLRNGRVLCRGIFVGSKSDRMRWMINPVYMAMFLMCFGQQRCEGISIKMVGWWFLLFLSQIWSIMRLLGFNMLQRVDFGLVVGLSPYLLDDHMFEAFQMREGSKHFLI